MLPYILAGTAGGFAATIAGISYMFPWLKYDLELIRKAKALVTMAIKLRTTTLACELEHRAEEIPNKPFIIFEDRIYTYEYIDRQATKVANLARSLGLKQKDTVAIMISNSPEFVWTFLGLSKVGVEVSFINFHMRGKSLLHCLKTCDAKMFIVGEGNELRNAVDEIIDQLDNVAVYLQGSVQDCPQRARRWDPLFEAASEARVPKSERDQVGFEDTVAYVYTSGTTGFPKPAIVTQMRFLTAGGVLRMGDFNSDDVVYTVLPLYHTAACMLGLGAVLLTGSTMVLRRKFSASHFWEDCRRHNVTVIQYIGEMCRYLLATPKHKDEDKHNIRLAAGNGLRPDIWEKFQKRFKIPSILEFYGATEGTAGFFNVHNKVGAVGRNSPLFKKIFPMTFVKFDASKEQPYRNAAGFCEEASVGEKGLLIVKFMDQIKFNGYKANPSQNEAKILRNVFKKGDEYYNSGDLFTMDKDYFVYFSDRTGDTFRWKGENVSTFEVGSVIAELPWVLDANVYGVKIQGTEGRAGMVTLALRNAETELSDSQMSELFEHCSSRLPKYAVPLFARVKQSLDLTSTFKQLKVELVKEGFDPRLITENLYWQDSNKKTYVPLTTELYDGLLVGKSKL